MDTEYDIDVAEASPLKAEIDITCPAKNTDLSALFGRGDPFAGGGQKQSDANSAGSGMKADGVDVSDIPF